MLVSSEAHITQRVGARAGIHHNMPILVKQVAPQALSFFQRLQQRTPRRCHCHHRVQSAPGLPSSTSYPIPIPALRIISGSGLPGGNSLRLPLVCPGLPTAASSQPSSCRGVAPGSFRGLRIDRTELGFLEKLGVCRRCLSVAHTNTSSPARVRASPASSVHGTNPPAMKL